MNVLRHIANIKRVFSGESIIDITYDQGVGRLDREPVLTPNKPFTESEGKYPDFHTKTKLVKDVDY